VVSNALVLFGSFSKVVVLEVTEDEVDFMPGYVLTCFSVVNIGSGKSKKKSVFIGCLV
jgi:hypothetical protein